MRSLCIIFTVVGMSSTEFEGPNIELRRNINNKNKNKNKKKQNSSKGIIF